MEGKEVLNKFNEFVLVKEGEFKHLQSLIFDCKNKLKEQRFLQDIYSKAREILTEVGMKTQVQVKRYIEDMVSLPLQAIYGDEYSFIMETEVKRNQTEIEFKILKGDIELNVKDEEMGGGILDVVSFGLRLVLWSLMKLKSDPVFLLDEPFKFVSKDKIELIGEMLKSVSEVLGIQILMITHDEELSGLADRSWVVKLKGKVSEVMQIN